VKNRRHERVYWRCAVRTCPATIRTLNNIPVGFYLIHNHPANEAKLEAKKTNLSLAVVVVHSSCRSMAASIVVGKLGMSLVCWW
jgi:hypothetical protein